MKIMHKCDQILSLREKNSETFNTENKRLIP